jgi:DNA topoisomerase-1
MEAELDRIEEGELEWHRVLDDFYQPFQRQLSAGEKQGDAIVRDPLAGDAGPCPECGKELAVRWNRFGRFLACTGYPDCRYTRSLDPEKKKAEPKATGLSCPSCGGELVEREGRFGVFVSCRNYPRCKYTQPRTVSGLKCPQCGLGDVGEKRTRRGKPFWGCTRYPECDWSSWDEPVVIACPDPACAAPYLVRKSTRARGEFLRCTKCRHEYVPGPDGSLEAAGAARPQRSRSTTSGAGSAKQLGVKRVVKKAGAKKAAAKKAAAKRATAPKTAARRPGSPRSGGR